MHLAFRENNNTFRLFLPLVLRGIDCYQNFRLMTWLMKCSCAGMTLEVIQSNPIFSMADKQPSTWKLQSQDSG
jgi:hypothetical protein